MRLALLLPACLALACNEQRFERDWAEASCAAYDECDPDGLVHRYGAVSECEKQVFEDFWGDIPVACTLVDDEQADRCVEEASTHTRLCGFIVEESACFDLYDCD